MFDLVGWLNGLPELDRPESEIAEEFESWRDRGGRATFRGAMAKAMGRFAMKYGPDNLKPQDFFDADKRRAAINATLSNYKLGIKRDTMGHVVAPGHPLAWVV